MGIQISSQNNYFSATINRLSPAYHQGTGIEKKSKDTDTVNPSESEEKVTNEAKSEDKTTEEFGQELSDKDLREVEKLKKRDLEVKAHEMAHVSAGGQYIRSSVNFEYKKGPDGKKYAVGGDVSIDMALIPGDPNATISKMQVVKKAALAPLNPSSADLKVAAKATRLEAKARIEASTEQAQKVEEALSKGETLPKEKAVSNKYSRQADNAASIEKGQMVNIAA